MRHYEVMVILDPTLEERTIRPSLDAFLSVVKKDGGTVEKVDVWGRRRLAYEIGHRGEAIYHLLLFTAPAETLAEITRVLKITDGVMRHGAYRRVQGSTHTKAPAQIPVGAPAAAAPVADDSAPPADDTAEAAE